MAKTCENRYQIVTDDLYSLVRVHPSGYFDFEQDFGKTGWERMNDPGPDNSYKIVVKHQNLGLFIKAYAPAEHDFAERVQRALEQLSHLQDLTVPPLLPLAVCNTTFIFQLGENVRSINNLLERWGDHRYKETYRLMYPIAHQERLRLSDHFELIKIGDQQYMADIFEDAGMYMTD